MPFKTILAQLRGEPNWSYAILNLVGNTTLFVPIGFLVPLVYRKMTWARSLALAFSVGLAMEGMEAAFRVGIFDVDDIILNALGVMLGYWLLPLFTQRRHRKLAIATTASSLPILFVLAAWQFGTKKRPAGMHGPPDTPSSDAPHEQQPLPPLTTNPAPGTGSGG